MKIVVILNNVRSSENVGSVFRTCDAAGVSRIILCGYTPTPVDRFGRENRGLTKASLGAEEFVKWEKAENLGIAVRELKGENKKLKIIGVEQNKEAIDYRKIKKFLSLKSRASKLAFVFGNEIDGLSEKDLKLCDLIAEIPMRGKKESLNVSVAVGVVLFELL